MTCICRETVCCALFVWMLATSAAAQSVCFGSSSSGRLEGGVQLPLSGPNFVPYSALGLHLGRTYVHSRVARTVAAAYHALESAAPGKLYVYGESGFATGGLFKPHRTHQNGRSVDFMAPVLDAAGRSVALPGNVGNQFGYALEFDQDGRFKDLRIDFEAIAEHLRELSRAAKAEGIAIERVIFDTAYLPALYKTRHGVWIKQSIVFMKSKPWVRHDEHYHVDFALPCRR